MNWLLLQTASILKLTLTPFGYIYGVIRASKEQRQEYNLDLAILKDKYGNVLLQYAMNDILITKEGYKFGHPDETISSCVGKNKVKGTLTKYGKLVDYLLNKAEKDHSIKSIDNTVNNNNYNGC